MQAQALICDDRQKFTLEEVTLPEPGPDQVLIRTLWSGVSIGTEFALIRNKISWGPYPLCTGYQGVGVVERANPNSASLKPGDKVYYRGNQKMAKANGPEVSVVSGTHCSHAVSTVSGSHGVERIPEGVADELGSLFVMPSVGYYGVNMAQPRIEDTVIVLGAGLIGLGVVAACSLRGCRVVAMDLDDKRLAAARELGADILVNTRKTPAQEALKSIAPEGADVVFEATGIPAMIDEAVLLCRRLGKLVMQGNYGETPITTRFLPAHGRHLTVFYPCDDGYQPCRRAVLKHMAQGALRWDKAMTHRVPASDAAAFYTRINEGKAGDVLGAAIRWNN